MPSPSTTTPTRTTTRRPPRPRVRQAQVVESTEVSPSMQRVVVAGHDLADFAITSPGGHIKVFLPPAGHIGSHVPVPANPRDPQPGEPRPIVRTYTPRWFDPATGHLAIDFAHHESGVATAWSRSVRVGDPIAVAGPGRGWEPDPDADWFLLGGDETAMPALIAIAAALPATAHATVVCEVPDLRDAQDMPSAAALEVRWRARGNAPGGSELEPALADAGATTGSGRVWIAGEAGMVRRLRPHFLDDLGMARDHVTIRGYWKRGVANHPDHDYGDD